MGSESLIGEHNTMKRLTFVMIGAAVLVLGACNKGSEDTVQNAELNQPAAEQLNEHANQAAMDAANEQAAAQDNIANDVHEQNAVTENVTNPTDAEQQNVAGM
jgi:hypothetical protein